LWRYRYFGDFPDGGCRHVEFSKILNFSGLSTVGGRYASLRQISSKSVKGLQRYGDLTIGAVKRHILHQLTKFRKDRSNRCGDIAIFVIFNMAAAAILKFQKFEILTAFPL